MPQRLSSKRSELEEFFPKIARRHSDHFSSSYLAGRFCMSLLRSGNVNVRRIRRDKGSVEVQSATERTRFAGRKSSTRCHPWSGIVSAPLPFRFADYEFRCQRPRSAKAVSSMMLEVVGIWRWSVTECESVYFSRIRSNLYETCFHNANIA